MKFFWASVFFTSFFMQGKIRKFWGFGILCHLTSYGFIFSLMGLFSISKFGLISNIPDYIPFPEYPSLVYLGRTFFSSQMMRKTPLKNKNVKIISFQMR